MRRRRFVFGLLSISALAPGLPALRAQQPSRLRRVAVLMLYAEKDPEGQARARAFREGLEKPGLGPGQDHRDRFPLGRVRSRLDASRHQPVAAARARRDRRQQQHRLARDREGRRRHADRLHRRERAGRPGVRREPRASRRQPHGVFEPRADARGQMGRSAPGDRARGEADRVHLQSGKSGSDGHAANRRRPRPGFLAGVPGQAGRRPCRHRERHRRAWPRTERCIDPSARAPHQRASQADRRTGDGSQNSDCRRASFHRRRRAA